MFRHGLRKLTVWLLLGTTILYLVTGFGITKARLVTAWSFGLLNKAVAFRIHEKLWIAFIIILLIHMIGSLWIKRGAKQERKAS
jgi:uncharacterized membrane protein